MSKMSKQDDDEYVVTREESGTARCPFERTHNSTTHYAGITTAVAPTRFMSPYFSVSVYCIISLY